MDNEQFEFKDIEKLNDKSEDETMKEVQETYKETLLEIIAIITLLYSKYSDTKGSLMMIEMNKFGRMKKYTKEIQSLLSELNTATQTQMINFMKSTYKDTFLGIGFDLETTLGISMGYSKPSQVMIEALIIDAPVGGLTIKQRLKINNNSLVNRVIGSLGQSIAIGEGEKKAMKRMSEVLNKDNRRLQATVRTERKRVSSIAKLESMEHAQSKGLKMKKVWVSTLDGRTRTSHRKLDGQKVAIDGYFTIRGHKTQAPSLFGIAEEDINCRCRIITEVDGFAIEDMQRRVKGEGVSKYKTYDEWYKNEVKK